jgi:single-strand DNA-binding protein
MSGETEITIVGNLTADPELRYTQTGLAVANFTVASTPRVFDRQSNDWKDGDPLFMRCSIWREFAEQVQASLVKGNRVIVTGNLKQRTYEKDGQKHTVMELEVLEIGPSLRYATAQVQRVQRQDAQQQPQQGQPQQQGGQYRPQPQQGQQRPQNPAQGHPEPWANTSGGDVWNTPGSYSDETPF